VTVSYREWELYEELVQRAEEVYSAFIETPMTEVEEHLLARLGETLQAIFELRALWREELHRLGGSD
jgi:hypothetical protein